MTQTTYQYEDNKQHSDKNDAGGFSEGENRWAKERSDATVREDIWQDKVFRGTNYVGLFFYFLLHRALQGTERPVGLIGH